TLSGIKFEGSAIEVQSDFDKYKNSPHHHVGFHVDDTLPGRVFESVSTKVSGELYLGDIDPKNVVIELVITDKENDTMDVQPLSPKSTNEEGLYNLEGTFKSPDGRPRNLRLRYFPTVSGLQNKFELGQASWL
ncbi:MAG: hypothetical protein NXH75_17945, partial [Halobacteriovoraceae bacterium]|nr:hypothetical protein [Halobacteriovoraceae bacterium]